ncbi:MAG: hypothetical protein P4L40_04285 [Terracidiphilus sp.]|nr:hypothetical protein [Terracidiphilus sp.]
MTAYGVCPAGSYELKKICKWADMKNFTHLMVVSEKAKEVNGCDLCALSYVRARARARVCGVCVCVSVCTPSLKSCVILL